MPSCFLNWSCILDISVHSCKKKDKSLHGKIKGHPSLKEVTRNLREIEEKTLFSFYGNAYRKIRSKNTNASKSHKGGKV